LLKKLQYYILMSPYPIFLHTDHKPLIWVSHSHEGPVTSELWGDMGFVDYVIHYKPGKENFLGDAMSRPPFVHVHGPLVKGMTHMLSYVLSLVPVSLKDKMKKVWAFSDEFGEDMRLMVREILPQCEVNGQKPSVKSVKNDIIADKSDLIILHVEPLRIMSCLPRIIERLKQGQSMIACLPVDLVHELAKGKDDKIVKSIACKINDCAKVVYLDVGLAWCIITPADVGGDHVLASIPNVKSDLITYQMVCDVNRESDVLLEYPSITPTDVIYEDGICKYVVGDDKRVIVPKKLMKSLIIQTHILHNHVKDPLKIIDLLSKYYIPNMSVEITDLLNVRCAKCAVNKARRRLAHAQYRLLRFHAPFVAYGIDFKKVKVKSDKGNNWILTIIDLFSRWVCFVPLPGKSARLVAQALVDNVFFARGIPYIIHADSAKEFKSTLIEELCQILQIKQTFVCKWPQANAITEHMQLFLEQAFRLILKERMSEWERYLTRIAAAHNSVISYATGFSPFEIDTLRKMRTVFAYLMDESLQDGGENEPGVVEDDVLQVEDQKSYVQKFKEFSANVRQLAVRFQDDVKNKVTALLNKKGTPMKLKVGDDVVFITQKKDGKALDTLPEASRGVIVKKLAETVFDVKQRDTGVIFRRHTALLRLCKIDDDEDKDQGMDIVPDEVKEDLLVAADDVGKFVAWNVNVQQSTHSLTSPRQKVFIVAKVVEVREKGRVWGHVWSTSGRSLLLSQLQFTPVWHGKRDGRTKFAMKRPKNSYAYRVVVPINSLCHKPFALTLKRRMPKRIRKHMTTPRVVLPLREPLDGTRSRFTAVSVLFEDAMTGLVFAGWLWSGCFFNAGLV